MAVDSCGSPLQATHVSLNYDQDKCHLTNDGQCASPVIAIVGPSNSYVAQIASSVLGVFEIPHIGIYATSDSLSDKTLYEYFLRLVSPDSYQIRAILDICQAFNWSYVSFVYSDEELSISIARSRVD